MREASVIAPRSLREALRAVGRKGVVAVAGGTDLLVRLHDVAAGERPSFLVLDGVRTLHSIAPRGKGLALGPLVTFSEIERSSLLRTLAPQLVEAASVAGSVQIRNRATLGGNIANGSPAGDLLPPLYVLSARLELSYSGGRRQVMIEDFFKGPGETVLRRNELITRVVFERSQNRGFFLRLAVRRALAISKVSVAANVSLRNGRVQSVRIALGAVAPTVLRASRTEEYLLGRELDRDSIETACGLASGEAAPIDDIRSEADYRREMVGVLLGRGLLRIASAR
ncbi:MAG: xanthine dehydrogenase family protein subunit M [Candidatus Eiseniibacteriota bacterium]|nr:MAG: xanthine dehydrogenase family protein subunit M [Candidatus Eisenbacteria bacterium]